MSSGVTLLEWNPTSAPCYDTLGRRLNFSVPWCFHLIRVPTPLGLLKIQCVNTYKVTWKMFIIYYLTLIPFVK